MGSCVGLYGQVEGRRGYGTSRLEHGPRCLRDEDEI
jgi:hypothetical protein